MAIRIKYSLECDGCHKVHYKAYLTEKEALDYVGAANHREVVWEGRTYHYCHVCKMALDRQIKRDERDAERARVIEEKRIEEERRLAIEHEQLGPDGE